MAKALGSYSCFRNSNIPTHKWHFHEELGIYLMQRYELTIVIGVPPKCFIFRTVVYRGGGGGERGRGMF